MYGLPLHYVVAATLIMTLSVLNVVRSSGSFLAWPCLYPPSYDVTLCYGVFTTVLSVWGCGGDTAHAIKIWGLVYVQLLVTPPQYPCSNITMANPRRQAA